ncbi:MAG: hypothetical protein ACRC2B_07095 [Rubrivivax sp.]
MRVLSIAASIGLALLVGSAAAEPGLKAEASGGFWSGSQASLNLHALRPDATPLRLGYQASTWGLAGYAPIAMSLSGDYHFSTDITNGTQARTGFRASSALLIRQPGVSLSDLAWSARSMSSFGVPAYLALPSLTPGLADPATDHISAMPYLGIGYSGVSLKSGWGFWADIGLVVQSPGNVLGLGRVLSGTQTAEDLMHELRLAPMVQLGVNYSF